MTSNNIVINGNYKHEKRGGHYHALLVVKDTEGKEKIVYVDQEQKVWCKNVDRFLNGMTLLDKGENKFLFTHKPNLGYVEPNDLIQNNSGEDFRVIYIANSHINTEDYPETVILQNMKTGEYIAVYNFKEDLVNK